MDASHARKVSDEQEMNDTLAGAIPISTAGQRSFMSTTGMDNNPGRRSQRSGDHLKLGNYDFGGPAHPHRYDVDASQSDAGIDPSVRCVDRLTSKSSNPSDNNIARYSCLSRMQRVAPGVLRDTGVLTQLAATLKRELLPHTSMPRASMSTADDIDDVVELLLTTGFAVIQKYSHNWTKTVGNAFRVRHQNTKDANLCLFVFKRCSVARRKHPLPQRLIALREIVGVDIICRRCSGCATRPSNMVCGICSSSASTTPD